MLLCVRKRYLTLNAVISPPDSSEATADPSVNLKQLIYTSRIFERLTGSYCLIVGFVLLPSLQTLAEAAF